MADKPEYLLISAKFNESTWAGCKDQVAEIIKSGKATAATPAIGIFVFRLEGAGYWAAQALSAYLRRAEIQFVQARVSNPLAGFLSEDKQKDLRNIGVEFWNKDA